MNQLAIWPILASNHLPYPNNALIHQLNSEVGMMTSTSNQAPALMDSRRMSLRVGLMTREYPPNIYGGAGVHVEYLTRELTRLKGGNTSVEVLCFGDQEMRGGNLAVRGVAPRYTLPFQDPRHQRFGETMLKNLMMAGMLDKVDVVHCHTWYTHL